MPYELFGKEISGRFTIPSGIVTTNVATIKRVAQDIPEVGIIATKSIGRDAREGNREPIIHCYDAGCPGTFINAVGLRNPGADKFAEELSSLRLPADKFLLASVFGAKPEDMVYVVDKLEPYVDGFELNFSCPHSPGHGTTIGHDPDSVAVFTKTVRERTKRPIFAKLSPNTDYIGRLALAAMQGGADGLTAINTVGPKVYTLDGHPILTSPVGGSLSGDEIKLKGIGAIETIRRALDSYSDATIIGMGGIDCSTDVAEYMEAGADYFGIGSALAGMSTRTMKEYFSALERGLANCTNESNKYLQYNVSGHKKFHVLRNKRLAEDLSLITLDEDFEIEPGQFAFVWIPGVGEKPYSLMENRPVTIAAQIRKRPDGSDGIFSKAFVNLAEGTDVYLRGPCGNPIEFDGIKNAVLVGGGTGIAALYPIVTGLNERGIRPECYLGAKDIAHLVYKKKFGDAALRFCSTDDGSCGIKDFVTALLDVRLRDKYGPSDGLVFFNCGPTVMVRKAEAIEMQYVPKEKVFSSEEELTMCGYGLCGSCAREDGLRRCVDGYFINPI